MKKNISFLILLIVFLTSLNSQANPAFTWSKINRDTRMLSMGASGLASTQYTAYSSFHNPAASAYTNFDCALSYQSWNTNSLRSHNFNFANSFSLGPFSLSSAVNFTRMPSMSIFDENGDNIGKFRPQNVQFNLGVAYMPLKNMSVGLSFKYFNERLTKSFNHKAIAGDIFLMYKLKSFSFSLGFSNIGLDITKGQKNRFNLPSSFCLSGSYRQTFFENHTISANIDSEIFFDKAVGLSFGLEYGVYDYVFFRGGYHLGLNSSVIPSFASAGLGLKYKKYSISFAYLFGSKELKNSFSVGLGYTF